MYSPVETNVVTVYEKCMKQDNKPTGTCAPSRLAA